MDIFNKLEQEGVVNSSSGRNSEQLNGGNFEMRGSFKGLKQRPNVKPRRTLAERKKSNTSSNVHEVTPSIVGNPFQIVAESTAAYAKQAKGKSSTSLTKPSSSNMTLGR